MNIELILRDVDSNQIMEDRIERRVRKAVSRCAHCTSAHVLLTAVRGGFRASVRVVGSGREAVGVATSGDNALSAFDAAVAKTERQIGRRLERAQRKGRRSRALAVAQRLAAAL